MDFGALAVSNPYHEVPSDLCQTYVVVAVYLAQHTRHRAPSLILSFGIWSGIRSQRACLSLIDPFGTVTHVCACSHDIRLVIAQNSQALLVIRLNGTTILSVIPLAFPRPQCLP